MTERRIKKEHYREKLPGSRTILPLQHEAQRFNKIEKEVTRKAELKNEVDAAVNAVKIEIFKHGDHTDSQIAHAKKIKDLHESSPIPDDEAPSSMAYAVTVEDPKEYVMLLRLGAEKMLELYKTTGTEEQINTWVKENARHEFAHARVARKRPHIKVSYGIKFLQNPENNNFGIQPFISVSTETPMTKEMYIDIARASKGTGSAEKLFNNHQDHHH